MDVEVKKENQNTQLKDHEVKELIKNSQNGDQKARDLLIDKCIVVPISGEESIEISSMKFSMIVKPIPDRSSSGFVVNRGWRASSRSGMPTPSSRIVKS